MQELARQHQEGELGGTKSIFQVQELARQHHEGALGGMRIVFHRCRSWCASIKKLVLGGNGISGAGAPEKGSWDKREVYFRCRSWRASIRNVRWGEREVYFRCRSWRAKCISVQELARQHDEGALGGTRSVFQIQELARQHDEGELEPNIENEAWSARGTRVGYSGVCSVRPHRVEDDNFGAGVLRMEAGAGDADGTE